MDTVIKSAALQNIAPFIEADASAEAGVLQKQMREDGYLFFRGLIPAEDVLRVRRTILEFCAEAGWLDPNRELMDGIAAPDQKPLREGMAEYTTVYRQVLRAPDFHAFPTNAALMQIAEKILGEEVLVHPRRIGRITFPNFVEAATPPHQDHFYIRGSVETYSCWTPLGDCPMELGGLAVLPRSQNAGFLEHSVKSQGVGGSGVPVEESETIWHSSDFGLGDALFFHSFTIHKALPNLTPDRLRISTDNRYQRPQEEIDPGSLKSHMGLV
jgi:ectoine hydroxylase-related dioxygenase (phytanoyl-CoA dioxygenase family)